ncbi:hydroxysqualene dehydroxylase HpnE [Undibacterium sp.]|uniref:hydroxysqualene dehydroxylase HpnE n=1 Tax=Undibacterium sp. TaxID=1914977 RepID=UPI0025CF0292|nr:hydroxysqualene dehydroxylase HpnE [Undibacterium sp.]
MAKQTSGKKIAVIGAGWAGCSAATRLTELGHQVTLIEAARTLGGRARRVELHDHALDNGQHILLGAYSETLALMKTLGIDSASALLTLPLQMCYPSTESGMHFVAPKLPAPLHLLIALLKAKGLSRADKLSLARFSTTARWMDWQLHQDCSVSELLQRFDQTEKLCRLMWVPLCIAALNTPPERASAQIFLNVLRDSLGAKRAASDMLIPRLDLSRLLPEAAARQIQQNGGKVLLGNAVKSLTLGANQRWQCEDSHSDPALAQNWDAIIIATDAEHAKRLLATIENKELAAPSISTNFSYEPITTCYLQYQTSLQLPRAFYALEDAPERQHWGQFVFDRGQLHASQQGLLAVVVSASGAAIEHSHAELATAIAAQLAANFQRPDLASPLWHKVISEKRATYSCTPGLIRPENKTSISTLFIAGDYTAGDYPATLEAAVRSGQQAASQLHQQLQA